MKAKAVAELTRLKQTGGFRWVTNYRNPLAKIPALAYEALIEGCCGAGLVRVCEHLTFLLVAFSSNVPRIFSI